MLLCRGRFVGTRRRVSEVEGTNEMKIIKHGRCLKLHLNNGDVHLVTIGWWNRFLEQQIKDLTSTGTNGLTSGPRGTGTNVYLEPREEAGRRGSQNAAG